MKQNVIHKIRNGLMMLLTFFVLHSSFFIFTACSDEWDDHYDPALAASDKTLLQLVESDAQLSDFLKVLRATHVYNYAKRTNISYADLLNADQSLTVWAPKNGTFNVDSLLSECQTAKGDSMVSRHFVMNHVSHNLYNMGTGASGQNVLLLNDKQTPITSQGIKNATIVPGFYNIPAKNGLLHVIDDDVRYSYSVYEGLTTISNYLHLGNFLKGFEKQELDEERSVQSGLVDGQKVYSDSVMILSNILYRNFGFINAEDSNYIALVPTKEIWEPVYQEALQYFNFGSVEKADSIQNYWVNRMLMQDLFYNRNMQHLNDSAFSTSYSKWANPEYHVFYKPLSEGGLFSSTFVKDTLESSNGVFYNLKKWPFQKEQIYFWPVKVEGEQEFRILDNTDCSLEYRAVSNADSISGQAYMSINPRTSSSNWTVTYEVPNTLSGTYDICAVCLPKTVYNTASRDFKPNKFKATLFYTDQQGDMKELAFDEAVSNDPYVVDTVKIGTFSFPVCNYQQTNVTVRLRLECSITRRETSFSRDTYLDCIYLKPTNKEEE